MGAVTMSDASIRQEIRITIRAGTGQFYTFNGLCDGREHFAVGFGDWRAQNAPLVRVHSECATGDLFGSARCDCGDQMQEAIDRMRVEGGVFLYLRQEGRGIGLYNKLDAYALQQKGFDTYEANLMLDFPADLRDYAPAVQMLKALGLRRIRLLSNNPDKVSQLSAGGIEIEQAVPTRTYIKEENRAYLKAKLEKGNHRLFLQWGDYEYAPA